MTTTAFDIIGGADRIHLLADAFYQRVLTDPDLAPMFRDPTENHAERMGWWLIEIFGGPRVHSTQRGGFARMVQAHENLNISEEQRQKWLSHMRAAIVQVKLPPSLVDEFDRYLIRGSGLAMATSRQRDASA